MSESQHASIWQFLVGDLSETDLVLALGLDPRENPRYLHELLAEAAHRRDAEGVEAALGLLVAFDQVGLADVAVLSELVVADWHYRQEDVARILQQLAAPEAVPALRRAAETDMPHLAHDDGRALARKCMWALSDIRTDEAIAALESLACSHRPAVRELAAYHLAKVHNDEPPSRASRRYRAGGQ